METVIPSAVEESLNSSEKILAFARDPSTHQSDWFGRDDNDEYSNRLLEYKGNYKGKLFLLKEDSWKEYSLGITVSI